MDKRSVLLLVIAAFGFIVCVPPALAQSPSMHYQQTATPSPIVNAPPNATATPTPFLPLPPTPTNAPTNAAPTPIFSLTPTAPPLATSTPFVATWEDYAGPTIYSGMGVPPPMGVFEQPQNQINILLLGSDQRPGQGKGSFRTDVILLVTLNTELETVNITSFPRDLYVFIPGWSMERINTAFYRGGFELLSLTLEYNFGVRPDHYALVNFETFKAIINELGGIDVKVSQQLSDHRPGYGYFMLDPGEVHMDGAMALWYVRSRKTTNDFDRTRRQQEVLLAILRQLIGADAISNAPAIYDEFDDLVKTDIKFQDLLPLIPLAAKIADTGAINSYTIDSTYVTHWLTYEGAQVLLPNQDAVRKLMIKILSVP